MGFGIIEQDMPTSKKGQKTAYILVGLGNPGEEYERTYHNAGRLALEAIEAALPGKENRFLRPSKKHFAYKKAGDFLLVEPTTFMNESGLAVREALAYLRGVPEHTIILHDDSDLPLGNWKFVTARGAAGHHGVESIAAALGTNEFSRVRIGIRPDGATGRRRPASEFVLKTIRKSDEQLFQSAFAGLIENVIEKLH